MGKVLFCLLLVAVSFPSLAQVGLGVYPSGSETGLSFKTSKRKKFYADIRMTNLNYSQAADELLFKSEVFAKVRFTYFERINFSLGLGPRMEYYSRSNIYWGAAAPVAVEAFPFPFPNAALFFEVAPFYSSDLNGRYHGGFRTASGINFYFVRRKAAFSTPEAGR